MTLHLGGAWREAYLRQQQLQARVAELEGLLDASTSELRKSQQRCRELDGLLRVSRERERNVEEELDRAVGVSSALAQQVDKLQHNVHAAGKKAGRAREHADMAGEDAEGARAALRATCARVHELDAALCAEREDNEALQAMMDEKDEQLERLQQSVASLRVRSEALLKAKELKDKHVVLLVKERDRAQQALLLNKAQQARQRVFGTPTQSAPDPDPASTRRDACEHCGGRRAETQTPLPAQTPRTPRVRATRAEQPADSDAQEFLTPWAARRTAQQRPASASSSGQLDADDTVTALREELRRLRQENYDLVVRCRELGTQRRMRAVK